MFTRLYQLPNFRILAALVMAMLLVWRGVQYTSKAQFESSITYSDFVCYYATAKVVSNGQSPYDYAAYKAAYWQIMPARRGQNVQGFIYLPPAIVMVRWLGLFELQTAWLLWQLCMMGFLLVSLWFYRQSAKLVLPSAQATWWACMAYAGFLATDNRVVSASFSEGQINPILCCLLMGGLYWLLKKRQVAGGTFYLATGVLKIFPVLLLTGLVARQVPMKHLLVLAGIGLLLCLPYGLYWPGYFNQHMQASNRQMIEGLLLSDSNISLQSLTLRFPQWRPLFWVANLAGAGNLVFAAFHLRQQKGHVVVHAALVGLTLLLLTPVVWIHHVLTYMPLILLSAFYLGGVMRLTIIPYLMLGAWFISLLFFPIFFEIITSFGLQPNTSQAHVVPCLCIMGLLAFYSWGYYGEHRKGRLTKLPM